jgi:hypothetical protein
MPIASDQLADDVVTVFKKTVPLTNAQIKALPTTPVEILAAPGEAKLIVPVAGLFNLDALAGAYSNVGAIVGFYPLLGINNAFGPVSNVLIRTALLAPDTLRVKLAPYQNFFGLSGSADVTLGLVSEGDPLSKDEIAPNEPLTVKVFNYDATFEVDQGNFTGGHEDNTLKVTVLYTIIDV